MEIELNLKPRSAISTTAFEETSLALEKAEKRLSETKKENDDILSKLKLKLAEIAQIEAYLRSLSTCDAIVELETQV